jgi:hypothetical protein
MTLFRIATLEYDSDLKGIWVSKLALKMTSVENKCRFQVVPQMSFSGCTTISTYILTPHLGNDHC